jgi:hypothetical protein
LYLTSSFSPRHSKPQGGFRDYIRVSTLLDTVGESFEPNIDTAQKAGTLTGPAKPMNLAQRSMPRKANLSHCRAAWAGSNVPVCSASIRLK